MKSWKRWRQWGSSKLRWSVCVCVMNTFMALLQESRRSFIWDSKPDPRLRPVTYTNTRYSFAYMSCHHTHLQILHHIPCSHNICFIYNWADRAYILIDSAYEKNYVSLSLTHTPLLSFLYLMLIKKSWTWHHLCLSSPLLQTPSVAQSHLELNSEPKVNTARK